MIWQVWWVWVGGGLVLAALEVLAPGYVFLGFAIGAVVTGLSMAVGLLALFPAGFAVQLLFFAGVSLVAWIALRAFLGVRTGQVKIWDRDIND